ncbi:axoneme-associated protein [Lasius niger]|uniref:Axoneme-associated protein n=1 Tax=Lasius niger TaxID=67767 RepID=A0A0J7JX50_LASNI|nr:axoneme-associated protein [Lasius niger]
MIDYIKEKGCEKAIDRVEEFKVGDRVDSDHMSIMVTLEERGRRGRKKEEGEVKREEEKWRICWDKESIQRYKENTEKTTWEEDLKGTIEEKWEKVKSIEAIIRKKVVTRKIELGHKDWLDRQCSRKKREVQTCYKKWRKGKVRRKKYLGEKRKMRELAEEKQRENKEKKEKELRNLKNTTEVWRFINRKRKKKVWKEAEISKEVWRYHFMELLEGKATRQGREPREDEEELIGMREEHAGRQLKRGDPNKAGNYRGISLLCSAYKIYAEILRNRLEEETERLDLLPESQAGFRTGRATMDNIFVLNHIIQKEKEKGSKERKVYALFVDLKAAFDNVEREQLWRILKEEGVAADLV